MNGICGVEIMDNRQTLIIMTGIPGSGKSTIAKYLRDGEIEGFEYLNSNNTKILSSDECRKQLLGDEKDQSDNKRVFDFLKMKMVGFIKAGYNVIIDATNINMKERRGYLDIVKRYDLRKVAYVVNEPFNECEERAAKREERPLSKEILFKIMSRFQCPQSFEGLEVIFHHKQISEDDVRKSHALSFSYISEIQSAMFDNMRACMDVFQDNPHHKYTINEHCRRTALKFNTTDDCQWLAARLHDIGKVFTRTYDENGVAHYYGHDNVGAYYICSHIPEIFFNENKRDILFAIFLINYHMLPFSIKEEKTEKKYKELFGEEWYNKLLLLHKADKENC